MIRFMENWFHYVPILNQLTGYIIPIQLSNLPGNPPQCLMIIATKRRRVGKTWIAY